MRISQFLLFAALSSTSFQAFAITHDDFPEGTITEDTGLNTTTPTKNLSRSVSGDTLTYSVNNGQVVYVKNSTIDTSSFANFVATRNDGYLYFYNTKIIGKTVTLESSVRLLNHSTVGADGGAGIEAENITLKDSAKVAGSSTAGDVILKATNSFVMQGKANINGVDVTANSISLESAATVAVQNSSFTAETISICGSSLQIGGEFVTIDEETGEILNTYIGNDVSADSIVLESGTLTLAEAALNETSITMNGGSLNILNNVEVGALTLNDGTLNFSGDYVIDLGNEDLILGDNVAITLNVDSLDNIEGITLFKNAGNVTGLDALTVTFVDATGAEKEAAVSFSNGSVVTGTIPEPTTATLSLLALAGLAARRRRR